MEEFIQPSMEEFAKSLPSLSPMLLPLGSFDEKIIANALSIGLSASPTPVTMNTQSMSQSSLNATHSISEAGHYHPKPDSTAVFDLAFSIGRYIADTDLNISEDEKDFYAYIIAGSIVFGVTFFLSSFAVAVTTGGTAANLTMLARSAAKGRKERLDSDEM